MDIDEWYATRITFNISFSSTALQSCAAKVTTESGKVLRLVWTPEVSLCDPLLRTYSTLSVIKFQPWARALRTFSSLKSFNSWRNQCGCGVSPQFSRGETPLLLFLPIQCEVTGSSLPEIIYENCYNGRGNSPSWPFIFNHFLRRYYSKLRILLHFSLKHSDSLARPSTTIICGTKMEGRASESVE